MTIGLERIVPNRKDGDERFRAGTADLGFVVRDFWRWSLSDLLSNASRGMLAEFIVAKGLGISTDLVRNEWAAYDLETADGIRIEVKSAAYLQSWAQKSTSRISFGIRKTREWDAESNEHRKDRRRHADVYVFALLAHQDKASVNPMDVDQWRFYVVPTSILERKVRGQSSITLRGLEKLSAGEVSYHELSSALRRAKEMVGYLQGGT